VSRAEHPGKLWVLFELRVHEDTDQVYAGHISLLWPDLLWPICCGPICCAEVPIITVFWSHAKGQRFPGAYETSGAQL
jgi:hypothetical protein